MKQYDEKEVKVRAQEALDFLLSIPPEAVKKMQAPAGMREIHGKMKVK